ncbi:cnh domain containing [Anaeramoeba flamelloides]|uniref:Cnh domain containing n=1 Tax=Anaeramoeba flamelloides TaxID=1746091 RepID=A0AAV8ADN0_9EUKA|nr:cnh domain containing [Anaeramoeba flamelloides]
MSKAFGLFKLGIPIKKVQSVAVFKENLIFLGTNDSNLITYNITKREINSNLNFSCSKLLETKLVKGKKNVEQILIKNNSIFLNVSNSLKFIDISQLKIVNTIQENKVVLICVDECDENDRVMACLNRKLFIYERRTKLGAYQKIKSFEISECPTVVRWYDTTICCGFKGRGYSIITYPSGEVNDLKINPKINLQIAFLKKFKEFLIVDDMSNLNLGICINQSGAPVRSTLLWDSKPKIVNCFSPYVIGILPKKITIHTFYDQQLLQELSLTDVRSISTSKFKIILRTKAGLFVLEKVPIFTQVLQMIDSGEYEKAIELFEYNENPNQTENEHKKQLRKIQIKIGFKYLEKMEFNLAFESFQKGLLDPRELISLLPGFSSQLGEYQPTNSFSISKSTILTFIENCLYQKRQLETIDNKTDTVENHLEKFRSLLLKYLESNRKTENEDLKASIDTTLMLLYAEHYPKKLNLFLSKAHNASLKQCQKYLMNKKLYHQLALIFKGVKMYQEALEIWSNLGNGNYAQKNVDPLKSTIELLSKNCDSDNIMLIWRYSMWVLARAPDKGIVIFTKKRKKPLPPNKVINFLKKYGNEKLKLLFIEFIVNVEKTEQGKYHTELAISYIDNYLLLINKSESLLGDNNSINNINTITNKRNVSELIIKLNNLLKTSTKYNPELLFSKIENTELYEEQVLLLDKLEQYMAAIKILLKKIKNKKILKKYLQDKDPIIKEKKLLSYLDYLLNVKSGQNSNENNPNVKKALKLINTYPQDLDPLKVFQIFPKNLPLKDFANFFNSSIRESVHQLKESSLINNLRKMEYLHSQDELQTVNNQSSLIKSSTICDVCKKRIGLAIFARFPNGKIAHLYCFEKDYMCPVTKYDFRKNN